jgi:hypothetical protein
MADADVDVGGDYEVAEVEQVKGKKSKKDKKEEKSKAKKRSREVEDKGKKDKKQKKRQAARDEEEEERVPLDPTCQVRDPVTKEKVLAVIAKVPIRTRLFFYPYARVARIT